MTRYIGIDPSTKTGICVIDGKEVYTKEITTKVKEDPQRFMDIAAQVMNWIKEGDAICIEGFSFGSKGAGVSTQYGIGWLIRAELIKNGHSYHEVSPTGLKKFACGKGNVKKEALVLPIFKRWKFESDSDNIRDAYVLSQIAKAMTEEVELTAYQKDVLKKIS